MYVYDGTDRVEITTIIIMKREKKKKGGGASQTVRDLGLPKKEMPKFLRWLVYCPQHYVA